MELADRRNFLRISFGLFAAFACAENSQGSVRAKSSQGYGISLVNQLEVIASCLDDARAAYEGGATRLELAVNLKQGGLTPPLEMVKQIVDTVPIPARVMLRENDGFSVQGPAGLQILLKKARAIGQLGVDGIVFGYKKDGRMDLDTMREIVSAAPAIHFTAHNAIENTNDPTRALEALKGIPRVDLALMYGGTGTLSQRIDRIKSYKCVWADDDRRILVNGFDLENFNSVRRAAKVTDFHVSQQVRTPEEPFPIGRVNALKVRKARKLLLGS